MKKIKLTEKDLKLFYMLLLRESWPTMDNQRALKAEFNEICKLGDELVKYRKRRDELMQQFGERFDTELFGCSLNDRPIPTSKDRFCNVEA